MSAMADHWETPSEYQFGSQDEAHFTAVFMSVSKSSRIWLSLRHSRPLRKSTVWSLTGENKHVYRKKRANNAYHLLVPLFSSFTRSVICHTLLLFSTSPFGIISFDFLYDSFTRALSLLSFPVLSAFTLISAQSAIFGISHATRSGAHDNTQMRY